MVENVLKEQKKPLVLIEDPLVSKNIPYLEEILALADGYRFLEAVQTPPYWTNKGVPTNTQETPLNTYLPGGKIVRSRYSVDSIRAHYQSLF